MVTPSNSNSISASSSIISPLPYANADKLPAYSGQLSTSDLDHPLKMTISPATSTEKEFRKGGLDAEKGREGSLNKSGKAKKLGWCPIAKLRNFPFCTESTRYLPDDTESEQRRKFWRRMRVRAALSSDGGGGG
ncbi:hypothetical protein IAU59_000685 [Kwoniella sp. CBS 9459]